MAGPTFIRIQSTNLLGNPSIAENTTLTSPRVVGTVNIVDLDGGANTLSLEGEDAHLYQLRQLNNLQYALELRAGISLDFETNPRLDVTVRARDAAASETSGVTANFAVNVTDVAEAPQITSNGGGDSATIQLARGTTLVTTVQAVDPDAGAKISYRISGGADASLFAINASTGALSFLQAPSGEQSSFSVQVEASDAGSAPPNNGGLLGLAQILQSLFGRRPAALTDTQNLTIITNSPPVLTAPAALTYTDTADDDTFTNATGTLSASDPDGDTITYGLSNSTSGSTTIGGITYNLSKAGTYGTLYLASSSGAYVYVPSDAAMEGLKTNATDSFTVGASDGGTPATQTLAVNITAKNDTPPVASNLVLGASITYTATDRDDPTLALRINASGSFTTQTATGTPPNYSYTPAEAATALSGVLEATDGSGAAPLVNIFVGSSAAETVGASTTGFSATLPLALYGFGGDDNLTGGTGNDYLSGGTGADSLTGGGGLDLYQLGASDNAIDTVIENGSALTANAGAITGFDVVQQFTNGQDILNFTPAMGATRTVITGTFANGVFTPGTASTDNDALVYGEAGTAGATTGELGVVLVGVGAGGVAANVDLNGAADGNGQNAAPVVTAFTATETSVTVLATDADVGDTLTLALGRTPAVSVTGVVTTQPERSFAITPTQQQTGTTNAATDIRVNDGSVNSNIVGTLIEGLAASQTLNFSFLTSALAIYGFEGNDNITSGGGNDSLFGGTGNDTLTGNAGADLLSGGDGNDSLNGGLGNDSLNGGTGTDVVSAYDLSTDGSDQINLGTETVTSATLNDVVNVSSTGASQIRVTFTSTNVGNGTGTGTSTDGALADAAASARNTVTLQAETAGMDSVTGSIGYADDEGTTFLTATGTSFDVRDAVSGAERGNAFNLVALGSSGNDTFDYSAAAFATQNLYVNAGGGNDTVTGNAGNDFLVGGSGNDQLIGGAGNDSYIGGTGNDEIVGGGNDDTGVDVVVAYNLATDGSDQINLGTETSVASAAALDVINISNLTDVRVVFNSANVGNGIGVGTSTDAGLMAAMRNTLTLQSSSGTGSIGYADDEGVLLSASGVRFVVSEAATPSVNNQFLNGQNLTRIALGTLGDDTLAITAPGSAYLLGGGGNDMLSVSGNNPNLLDGGTGNDTIVGSGNSDLLIGGDGDDTLSNVNGGATVQGGDGNDTFIVTSTSFGSFASDNNLTGVETVRAATGTANIDISIFVQTEAITLVGNDGNNVLQGSNTATDSIQGGDGNDTLRGGGGNDTLRGEAGNDSLEGGSGNNMLFGGDGNDVIRGDSGNDTLTGGAGGDTLIGGGGNNRFVIAMGDSSYVPASTVPGAGVDTIESFQQSPTDTIDFGGNAGSATNYSETTATVANFAAAAAAANAAFGTTGRLYHFASDGTNGYLFHNRSGDTALGAGDDVVVLQGVNADNFSEANIFNPPPPNATPVVTAFTATGTSVTVLATDADAGDTLTLALGRNPAVSVTGVNTANANERSFSITPAQQDAQAVTFIRVNDGTVNSASFGLLIEGTAANGGADGSSFDIPLAIYGFGGNDIITGGGGNDSLFGGDGNDTLNGGDGDDVFVYSSRAELTQTGSFSLSDSITGGAGTDTIRLDIADGYFISNNSSNPNNVDFNRASGVEVLATGLPSSAAININLRLDIFSITGIRAVDLSADTNSAGNNVINAFEAEASHNLTLTGSAGNDNMASGAGADTLLGGAGNDTLNGFIGNDSLLGGEGNDRLNGERGADTLTGGGGADAFFYQRNGIGGMNGATLLTAPDTITDFVSGVDRIIMEAFLPSVPGSATNYREAASAGSTLAANLAAANAAFAASSGTVTYYLTDDGNGMGLLFIDSDSRNGALDGVADGVIQLVGITQANFAFTDITSS